MISTHWKLANLYLWYFALLGGIMPFWGLYLESLGYIAQDIGLLMGILSATKIIAPNIWGYIIDHTHNRLLLLRIATLLSLLSFSFFFIIENNFWLMAVIMFSFSFFWNAKLPQLEAIVFNYLQDKKHQYTQIRLWGSLGFIIIVLGLGAVFETYTIQKLPLLLLFLLIGLTISLYFLKNSEKNIEKQDGCWWKGLQNPIIWSVLLISFFLQASHGAYYSFFSLYLKAYNYTETWIGFFWAIGVFAEILLFLFLPKWLLQHGARKLLLLAAFLTTLRWIIIAFFAKNFILLLIAQTFHAASYGLYHGAAIQYIHHFFKGNQQVRGQALYASIGFGLGVATGSIISGYIWNSLGMEQIFLVAALLASLGWWIGYYFLPNLTLKN